MKKILVAIDHFKAGGAERVASVIINHLCKENEVHVVIMEEEINYPLDFNHIKLHVINYNNKNKITKIWTKISQLRQIIRNVNADIIFSFANIMSIYVAAALIRNGRDKVCLISSERTDPTHEPSNLITKKIRNWAYQSSDYLVCQTPWVANYFNKRIHTKCVVIPNPITPSLPIWKGENSKIIMTACRLEKQKNLPMLIKAFVKLHKYHSDYKLVIYGDGTLRSTLKTMIENYKMNDFISMPGFTKNIHKEMVNSYMYVSSSNYEGISNSMLEALGIGIPTICTDCPVGGASMFITNKENGLLVPVNDENELFNAMKIMIENKELALKCSQNSQNINEQINVNAIVNEWINIIK